mgnify:CR=1 FL=1
MMQIVPSKCPACEKMVGQLEFFGQVKDKYFYVCKDCLNTPLTKEDLLTIGFCSGQRDAKQEVRDFLESIG